VTPPTICREEGSHHLRKRGRHYSFRQKGREKRKKLSRDHTATTMPRGREKGKRKKDKNDMQKPDETGRRPILIYVRLWREKRRKDEEISFVTTIGKRRRKQKKKKNCECRRLGRERRSNTLSGGKKVEGKALQKERTSSGQVREKDPSLS